MKASHLLVAGTLTFNIALTAALVRGDFGLAAYLPSAQADAGAQVAPSGQTNDAALTRSAETQSYILDTIRANPQAVLEALAVMQARHQAAQEASNDHAEGPAGGINILDVRLDIEDSSNAHVEGNLEGSVQIVEFFDYNCPYCRASAGLLDAVLEGDKDLGVIYREYPILSDGSVFASKVALAARNQGLYKAIHDAFMSQSKPIDRNLALQVAQEIGADVDLILRDIEAPEISEHLRSSQNLAERYGITGTPAFSINGKIHVGAPTLAHMKALIEAIRASKADRMNQSD